VNLRDSGGVVTLGTLMNLLPSVSIHMCIKLRLLLKKQGTLEALQGVRVMGQLMLLHLKYINSEEIKSRSL